MVLKGLLIFLFLAVGEVNALTPNKYCQTIPAVACEVLNISDALTSTLSVNNGTCIELIRTYTVKYCKLGVFYQAPIRQVYGASNGTGTCKNWNGSNYYNVNYGTISPSSPGVADFTTPTAGACP